jgi:hypothetical protein
MKIKQTHDQQQRSYSSTQILNQEEDLAFDAAMAQEFSTYKRSALNYNSDSAAESSGPETQTPSAAATAAANRRKIQKTIAARYGMSAALSATTQASSDDESDEDPAIYLPPICRRVVFGSYSQMLGEGEKAPDSHTHKWKLFVQGYQGEDMTHWCRQVVIKLHESFAQAKRGKYISIVVNIVLLILYLISIPSTAV